MTTNASAAVAPGGTAAWTRADREHLAWLRSLPASPEVERSIAATEKRIMEMERGRPHEEANMAGALAELRDALEDAIRRSYCEPLIQPVDGEDPSAVRAFAQVAVVANPSKMRHLAAIQAAAWAVVAERVEDMVA